MKFIIFFLLLPYISVAQNTEDHKVIVTLSDSSDIYKKVKIALVKEDFIVKDDGDERQISTYPRELKQMKGYAIVKAELNGNTVILSGIYGLTKINDWGYTSTPKNYKRIIYFKGSKTWKLLLQIANKLGGTLSYSK